LSSAGAVIDGQGPGAIQLLAAQERGVADVQHLGLAQHLADDHLDVLVVDLHALQAVDLLDLANQVVGQRLDAHAGAGCRAGSGSPSAMTSPCATCSPSKTLSWRHLGISSSYFVALFRRDDQTALALGSPCRSSTRARTSRRGWRCSFGLAGLEQIGHARQTAGDVAGLRGLPAGCGR
jgi:hypothetical protein